MFKINKAILFIVTFLFLFGIESKSSFAAVEVLESNKSGMVISYIPELQDVNEVNSTSGEITAEPRFKDAYNVLYKAGYPQLFAYTTKIIVPSEKGFEITDVTIGNKTIINKKISPVRIIDTDQRSKVLIDENAYNSTPPDEWVSLEYAGIGRFNHLAELKIIAAKYNPDLNRIEIPENIIVRIKFIEDGSKSFLFKNEVSRSNELPTGALNSNLVKEWTVSDPVISHRSEPYYKQKGNEIQSKEDISSGNWYKIKINEQGLYKLDADYLSENGITIPNSELNTIKIFGKGGKELPRNVSMGLLNELNEQEVIVKKNGDGSLNSIVFYGGGPTGFEYGTNDLFSGNKYLHYRNHYSNTVSYLLTWGGKEGKRAEPEQLPGNEIENELNTYTHRTFIEEELTSPFHGGSGKQFVGRSYFNEPFKADLYDIENSGEVFYRFSLAHDRTPESEGYFTIKDHNYLITDNFRINKLGERTYVVMRRNIEEYTVPVSDLPNKDQISLNFKYSNPKHNSATGYFDYVEIFYPRKAKAIDNEASFLTDPGLSGITQYNFSGFSGGNVYAFDITDVSSPKLLKDANSSSSNTFELRTNLEDGTPKRFYLSSKLKNPISIESTNFTGLRFEKYNKDMILITHSELTESAKKYKQYRESQGEISVGIFTTDEIYNEFNAGTPDVTAIRDFIAHAFNNWDVKPKYVFLWGDGHFDYRNIMTSRKNLVPPNESDDNVLGFSFTNSTTTDDYYVRVAGNDEVVDLGIGRATINKESEGEIVLNKIKHYENNSSRDDWRTKMTLVADDGYANNDDTDGDDFVVDSENLMGTKLPDFLKLNKIYSVQYPTIQASGRTKPSVNVDIVQTLNNQGSILLNYYGHGNPKVWAHESILDRDVNIKQMTNLDKLFFLTAATCDFAKFDSYDIESGAEMMFLNEYGGSIGSFASSRAVFGAWNHSINKTLYENIFKLNGEGKYRSLGEVIFNVKLNHSSSNDEKFFLLGDPALRLLIPKNNITIDSINGLSTSEVENNNIHLKGLEKTIISGTIRNSNSEQVLNDFNGELDLKIHDGDVNLEVKDKDNRSYRFVEHGGLLAQAKVDVMNGKWSTEVILPKDISFSENTGRIFTYAKSDDDRFAKGSYNNIKVDGLSDNPITDNTNPEISIYLDSRDFKAGDIVRNEPLLIVDLWDDTGINSTGVGIGHKIEAWIDDNEESINLTPSYQSSASNEGTVEKRLLNLEPGPHKVKVRAWDIFNNYSTSETYFNIISDVHVDIVKLSPSPFRDITEINFKHNLNPPVNVKVDIFTSTGRKIRTLEENVLDPFYGSIEWDGTDDEGAEVISGTYYLRVYLESEGSKATFLKGKGIKIK